MYIIVITIYISYTIYIYIYIYIYVCYYYCILKYQGFSLPAFKSVLRSFSQHYFHSVIWEDIPSCQNNFFWRNSLNVVILLFFAHILESIYYKVFYLFFSPFLPLCSSALKQYSIFINSFLCPFFFKGFNIMIVFSQIHESFSNKANMRRWDKFLLGFLSCSTGQYLSTLLI